MNKTATRKILAVLLAVCMLLQGMSAAASAIEAEPVLCRYVFDETDADGNFLQPYYVDRGS